MIWDRMKLKAKRKSIDYGHFYSESLRQSGARAWGTEGPGLDSENYCSGGKEVLEGEGGTGAGKEKRLGENLGPWVPLPQTKIKTRILKGDLITQSQGWRKGWAGGHCLPWLQRSFLYIPRGPGRMGWPLCKLTPPTPHPHPMLQFSRFIGVTWVLSRRHRGAITPHPPYHSQALGQLPDSRTELQRGFQTLQPRRL